MSNGNKIIIKSVLFFGTLLPTIQFAQLYVLFNIIDPTLLIMPCLMGSITGFLVGYYRKKTAIYIEQLKENQVELENNVLKKTEELRHLNNKLKEEVEIKTKENIKQKEALFLQSKKAAMGDLIGVIAHQLKQPLNAINLSAMVLIDDFEYDGLTKESLADFEKSLSTQVDFMSKSIDELRNFFRPDKVAKEFSLKSSIEKILSLLSSDLVANKIKLQLNITEDININGFENELEQVILNIVNNAKDILIDKKPDQATIIVAVSLKRDDKVIITITDNGGGVPEDIIDKIFDSYFTTKGEEGTGIGLNLVKMIIEDSMGGKISIRNTDSENMGRGAQFIIEL